MNKACDNYLLYLFIYCSILCVYECVSYLQLNSWDFKIISHHIREPEEVHC